MSEIEPPPASIESLEARLRFLERSLQTGRIGSWRARLGPESLLELSDHAYVILGVELGTPIRNLDFYRMIHPDDRERFLEIIISVRSNCERQDAEIRFVDPKGIEHLLVITIAPAGDETAGPGAVTGTFVAVDDPQRCRPNQKLVDQLAAERELHQALEAGELFLEYQPILSLSTNAIAGAEALVRWQHPTKGRLLPEEFVGQAEQSGLIYLLGSWALAQACQDLKVWLDAGLHHDFVMSVNLSAMQLHTQQLPMAIETTLSEAGIRPSNVLLEVTESVLVEGTLDERSLRAIRDQGVRVAIDDFGTKYSTLAYLPRLPVDVLKIDRSFVEEIQHAHGLAVIAAITTLGHALGLDVTAEGIETERQLDAVRELMCDSAQGFFISPPLNSSAFLSEISSLKCDKHGIFQAADGRMDQLGAIR